MGTKRLFDQDAYLKQFDATVEEVKLNQKNEVMIRLDQTAFFPEGGGQAGDSGIISLGDKEIRIKDTQESDNEIWHICAELSGPEDVSELQAGIDAGASVHGSLDWKERFSRMQNHSGEHIVSGLIHQKYGYENIGFHMGSEFITIDLSGPLNMEELTVIQHEANQVIWNNLPIQISTFSDSADLEKITYRSKKELTGEVRIVTIPDVDICACCGTHVAYTGEIGLIAIFSCTPFHGGVRIEMLSGERAYRYYQQTWMQNHQISTELSAPPLETAQAVAKMKEKALDTAYLLQGMRDKEIQTHIEALKAAGDVFVFEDDCSVESIRKCCTGVIEASDGICMVLTGTDQAGYKYAVGQKNGNLKDMIKQMNMDLNGRGGGKPFFMQGSLNASKSEIVQWFETNYGMFREVKL